MSPPIAASSLRCPMIKNEPCAFCGSVEKDNPRTKGHVLQKSMYPEVGFENVRRITVPECKNALRLATRRGPVSERDGACCRCQ